MALPSFNITNFLTLISNCDNGTGWNITDVDTDIKVEGGGSGYDAIRNGGTITYTFPSAVDMSATDIHIRQWLQHTFPSYLHTKANGGIQLFIGDGSNTAYWYVGGSDNHNGAWQLFQADLSSAPDSGTLPSLSAITKFGFVLDHATAARNVSNTYWDIATFAKGYEIYGGTSGDNITWATLASADTGSTSDKQYGVVELIKGGAFYVNSGLWIGDSTGTSNTYFDGTNQTIIFYDLDEKIGLYKIVGSGNSTGETHVDLSGSVIKSASSSFLLDMSGANVTYFKMDGSTVENVSSSIFKSGQSIKGTVFSSCGTILHNGSNIENCTIVSSGIITVTSLGTFYNNLIDAPSGVTGVNCTNLDDLEDGVFQSSGTGHAVTLTDEITSDISMSWDNISTGYATINGSTGNEDIKVNVASGIKLTINVQEGKTAPKYYNTGAGTVEVVVQQIILALTGLPDGIEVRIRQGSFTLKHVQNVSGGQIVYNYTYVSDKKITVSFTGSGIIQSKTIKMTLKNSNQTSLVTFENDPSYST